MVSLIQHFEADFLWKVSLKIWNSGIILKTFTYVPMLITVSYEKFFEPVHEIFILIIYVSRKGSVLCLDQNFLGTLVSPYLNFRATFANSGGHTKSI